MQHKILYLKFVINDSNFIFYKLCARVLQKKDTNTINAIVIDVDY